MAKRTPPLLTPFAIMSIVLALGATNVAVNEVTHTSEGRARVSTVSSSSSSVESVSQSSESRPEPDRRDESSSSSEQQSSAESTTQESTVSNQESSSSETEKKAQAPRLHQAAARARLRQARLRQTTKTMKGVNKRCSAFLE